MGIEIDGEPACGEGGQGVPCLGVERGDAPYRLTVLKLDIGELVGRLDRHIAAADGYLEILVAVDLKGEAS